MGATSLTWLEVNVDALESNARTLRLRTREDAILAPVVKANGYGHGLILAWKAFEAGGADWLCVHELSEAISLREAGCTLPLYVVGYVPPEDAPLVVRHNLRIVVYSRGVAMALAEAVRAQESGPVPVHLKLETGNHRQGLPPGPALALAEWINESSGLTLEGLTTHFADVEDTTNHSFARLQLERFEDFLTLCSGRGIRVPMVHAANSAATLLWSHAHKTMVRPGISSYGLWPSSETLISCLQERQDPIGLRRALTWKARVAQIQEVDQGEYVGYGRTYRTTHLSRIAVVCVGYYDGYDRKLSNQAYVLIHGHRAPVRGRVCMNLLMVDVTHVPGVVEGDEVVLMGSSGEEEITPEQMADWAGTIHYEVLARIHERLPRIPVRDKEAHV